ncbi:cytochrome c oxidase subunit II [Bacteroidia bacterium]|nr:cytochrome c oxidase subunit II [Bacteroidia bacterium]
MKKTFKLLAGILGLISLFGLLHQTDFSLVQLAASEPSAAETATQSSINWLLIIVSILIGGIIVLIFDITNLTTRVTGKNILDWNKLNAWLCLVFLILGMGAAFWEFFYHGKYVITEKATAHAENMNMMFNATLFFTGIVFVIVQVLLFYFLFKYRTKEGRKATYYSHNNKLEIVWTAIPFVTMAVLVLMGMKTWSNITKKSSDNPKEIEIYAYQFGWNARYSGADNIFGEASFNYISGTNPLGLPVDAEIDALIVSLTKELNGDTIEVNGEPRIIPGLYTQVKDSIFNLYHQSLLEEASGIGLTYTEDKRNALQKKIESIESGAAMADLEAAIYRKEKQIQRIAQIRSAPSAKETIFNGSTYDDVISNEIHLVKGEEVIFLFRARDVIHSAWMPHFKVQMNVVPGMQTRFRFTPIKTTAEARVERGNEEYDYYMFCNKVCGSAHYNMKIKVVVETQAEFDEWMKTQKPAFAKVNQNEVQLEEVAPKASDSAKIENKELALK